jgi:MFS family permease
MAPQRVFRALRHRNVRLFFAGQIVSLSGSWMQQMALAWLVYRLTSSPFWLGLVGFAGQIPIGFIAPVAGVLTDRWNCQRTLLITQTLAMGQALLLAVLALADMITLWQIILLNTLLGFVNAFDLTTRQAFLAEMVAPKEDLANAIALNSSLVHSARMLGPLLAGILIATTSEGVCFLVNGVSYLPVLGALAAMSLPRRPKEPPECGLWDGLREGWKYTFGFPPIRSVLLLLALVSLLGLPYTLLLPVFAIEVLHGGPDMLGYLMTASGVGSLVGAVYLASRQGVSGSGRRIAFAAGVFGLGLILFAFSQVAWLALPILFVMGFAVMVQIAASNTILQTLVKGDKRGRVMSFYTVAFLGMAPLGSLLTGSLASAIGTPGTFVLGGICCLVGTALFARQLPPSP